MADLTPAEAQFFATGELPPELATQVAEPADAFAPAPAPAAAPAPSPAPAPAPSPAAAAPDPAAELKLQLESERARLRQMEVNFSRLAERAGHVPEAAAPAPVAPDPLNDPLGALMHQLKLVTDNVTAMQQKFDTQATQTAQQQQFVDFQQNIVGLRNEFTKTTPDFPQAYAHLRAQRSEDLRDLGIPESRLAEALLHDEIAATQTAISQGKNPAQVIYNMAKRSGYVAKAAPQGAPQTAEEKIAAIKAGTAADPVIQRADSTQQLTFEGLKDASDSDLNKMVQDNKQWANLVGNIKNDIF